MNAIREEQLLRAIKATADLVGYTIKKVSTGDDLKMRTMTIAFETASSGHVQEVLNFEREHLELMDLPPEGEPDLGLEVMTDGDGHVEQVRSQNGTLDPSDLTETDETQLLPPGDDTEKVGAATGEPREGIEVAVGDVVELSGKKRR